MSVDLATATGEYLYAVVPAADGAAWQAQAAGQITGIDGASVYCISDGPVAAVVSDLPNQKTRPERRRLAAHHNILKSLMKECTVLPMSFGNIADGPKAIRRILSLNQESFTEHLRRLDQKMEMGLRVSLKVPNIFDYFAQTHPELRALRDRSFAGGREATQDEKVELGRLFSQLLSTTRDTYADKVESVVGKQCFETKHNKPRDEREVMNLACLIGRDAQGRFEEAIVEAAAAFDDNFCFDFNGPWPPHNFVSLQLQL